MEFIFDYLREKAGTAVGDGWRWFSLLSREEWMVVLGACCVLGFLCMRGYGSRNNY